MIKRCEAGLGNILLVNLNESFRFIFEDSSIFHWSVLCFDQPMNTIRTCRFAQINGVQKLPAACKILFVHSVCNALTNQSVKSQQQQQKDHRLFSATVKKQFFVCLFVMFVCLFVCKAVSLIINKTVYQIRRFCLCCIILVKLQV